MFAKRVTRNQGRRKASSSESENAASPAAAPTRTPVDVLSDDEPGEVASRASPPVHTTQRKLAAPDENSGSEQEFFRVKKSKASRRMARRGLVQKKEKKTKSGPIVLPDTDPSDEDADDLDADIEEATRQEEAQAAREKREQLRQGINKHGEPVRRKPFNFKPQPEARPSKATEAFDISMDPAEIVTEIPVVATQLSATQALANLEQMIVKAKIREQNAKTRIETAHEELEGMKISIEQTKDQMEKAKSRRELMIDCEEQVKDIAGLIDAKAGKVSDAVATLRGMEKEASKERWTGEDEFGRALKWPSESFVDDRISFLKAVHKQLLKDIGDNFSALDSLLKPFSTMKKQHRGLYTSAYIPRSIKEVVQTHIKLELLWWDPLHFVGDIGDERPGGRSLIHSPSLDDFEWFEALCDYSLDDNDPDTHLVPSMVKQEVYPIISHYIQIWDMRNADETRWLRDVVEESVTFLENNDKPLRDLEKTLKERVDNLEISSSDAAAAGKNLAMFHDVFAEDFLGALLLDLWSVRVSKAPAEQKWDLLLEMIPANALRSHFQPLAMALSDDPRHAFVTNQIMMKLQGR
eukprot:GEMP01031176.1.p1 GENE.GEMP01031176.1~~GEMP01031176.1.p1  ORF type:complete len:580 (+),score=137.98 GEMP01031176.1:204-1943(+)